MGINLDFRDLLSELFDLEARFLVEKGRDSGDRIMSGRDAFSKTMIAKPAESAAATAVESTRLSPDAEPDSVANRILALLSEEKFQTARRLAAEAVSRFPEHERLRGLWGIFDNRGKAVVRPGNEPSRSEELQWLRNPPESARGKWVALVGSELVGVAETLEKLIEALESKELTRRPLVHQVDG